MLLPGIGEEGQHKLLDSSVLIVGLGGLGSPVALYLAAAGVGRLGLCDSDRVSLSNLQRQVLYNECQVGDLKADCAANRLYSLNSGVMITEYTEGLTVENASRVINRYDIVVDCTDNHATRYLISDTCRQLHKPWVHGSIGEYRGQVSTFLPDGPIGYEDLFPDRHELSAAPPASGGVFGALPGAIGSIQAAEVLKLITGVGEPLSGRLFVLDLLTMQSEILSFA